jgi:hypothetical protein
VVPELELELELEPPLDDELELLLVDVPELLIGAAAPLLVAVLVAAADGAPVDVTTPLAAIASSALSVADEPTVAEAVRKLLGTVDPVSELTWVATAVSALVMTVELVSAPLYVLLLPTLLTSVDTDTPS